MFVVLKNDVVWGYYDTKAETIAAMEEERRKEDPSLRSGCAANAAE